MGTGLQKAKIKVYRTPVEEISCLFNPAEYKISAAAGYAKKNKSLTKKTMNQYVGGYESALSLTLYYDITDNLVSTKEERKKTSVREYTQQIEQLLQTEDKTSRPPLLEFIWGDLIYKGVLTSLNQEFIYFDRTGKPLRAKLDLTISTAAGEDEGGASAATAAADITKSRMVTQGMTLSKLAYEEYGDSNQWTIIAEANDLMNPLDIKVGQVVSIPPLDGR